ncbi:hypothetical protein [Sedimentimonas flavescens]|uniref:hypothetical protein n=1 Tax=Sedimentimonas flavescens TaxID=2851012 RepID=UPI0021A76FA7|nr:hypothetical protein [Sedimentimonas flavescens]MCT2541230.1 hypothetical protein [Sedimentimonas flavescens]
MNSLSVVLAADSATTVEYYGQNGAERRYFKGANKIFQLSEAHPVGLMIYNSASLLSVPWEVTIKEFRKELGDKSFNTVEGFADEFIAWVDASQRLFPDDIRRSGFVKQVSNSLVQITLDFNRSRQEDDTLDFSTFMATYVENRGTVVQNSELNDDEIGELTASTKNDLINELDEWLDFIQVTDVDEATRDMVIDEATKQSLNMLALENNYSGLIFAGFGDHSVFPELVSYSRCKLWGTKFVASKKKVEKVTHDIPAVLSAFAQSSMTDTFEVGLSFEVFAKMQETFAGELKAIADSLNELSGGTIPEARINELIGERLKSSKDKIFQYARAEHSLPLRRVLGVLPVDEMAELAETLINLQSLKEKVTKPSETVGGPVDVAAITRSEGLVWIKRKHFFDPSLNSRFFERRR